MNDNPTLYDSTFNTTLDISNNKEVANKPLTTFSKVTAKQYFIFAISNNIAVCLQAAT